MQQTNTVKINSSWYNALESEFQKTYFGDIKAFILEQKKLGKTIYPPSNLIFNAFENTSFEEVKVVILGQDPYHGAGQAHGLSFSVQDGVAFPPSLKNIFKELETDIPNFKTPKTGNLTPWTKQGVLLLNAFLTVNANEPASHQKAGWEQFTNAVIQKISEEKKHIVFILWGKFAQEKKQLIDNSKHLILQSAHPSPFSAHNGFFGCKHFSKTNAYLETHEQEKIDWKL